LSDQQHRAPPYLHRDRRRGHQTRGNTCKSPGAPIRQSISMKRRGLDHMTATWRSETSLEKGKIGRYPSVDAPSLGDRFRSSRRSIQYNDEKTTTREGPTSTGEATECRRHRHLPSPSWQPNPVTEFGTHMSKRNATSHRNGSPTPSCWRRRPPRLNRQRRALAALHALGAA
jgi:hypothetical protein